MKIWGREPALWLALIAVLVKLGAAFGLHVTPDQQAAINAVAAAAAGLIVAYLAHEGGIAAAALGLIQAAASLAVGFGLDWSADQQAVVMSAAAAIAAMWTRTQVTPPVPAADVRRE
ncbi:hypothetical protein [Kitasatospora camelliae]|uniref:Holin n=1 Tax=Kitasatospora camelliae TaxID=3156397 RepID=A0AAU8K6D2_9ACTN